MEPNSHPHIQIKRTWDPLLKRVSEEENNNWIAIWLRNQLKFSFAYEILPLSQKSCQSTTRSHAAK